MARGLLLAVPAIKCRDKRASCRPLLPCGATRFAGPMISCLSWCCRGVAALQGLFQVSSGPQQVCLCCSLLTYWYHGQEVRACQKEGCRGELTRTQQTSLDVSSLDVRRSELAKWKAAMMS